MSAAQPCALALITVGLRRLSQPSEADADVAQPFHWRAAITLVPVEHLPSLRRSAVQCFNQQCVWAVSAAAGGRSAQVSAAVPHGRPVRSPPLQEYGTEAVRRWMR